MSRDNEKTFQLGASHTIGSYILPGESIDTIHQEVEGKIKLTLAPCDEIVKAIKEKRLDLGFIESPIFDESVVYREWMEDELVLCSKKELARSLYKEDLNGCRLISREKGSLNREFIENFLHEQGLSYDDFHALSEVDNPTAIVQSIKWSRPLAPITSVAIVSKISIEYELKYKDLYASTINDTSLIRKFYMLYREDSPHINRIERISNTLIS